MKVASAKPVGTSVGLEKSFAPLKDWARKKLPPSTVQVGASAVVQWMALMCGVRTSVPSGVQSPVVPSVATGRICSLPKAD